MRGELDLQTLDDGGLYLAESKTDPGRFVLSVTEASGADVEVKLDAFDVLRVIHAASRLLMERGL
ncbi:hypothetical protein AB0J80_35925 [Actinoplanes sp. NPDC049548]|uniref:hypothetical protein n=1 Tax=Actinoplanes sp. NPDC049548 TaxID=3155152 RepID=UPI00342DBB5F